MPVSINNTQIVFNDATTQSTAAVVNTTAVLSATAGASLGAVGTYAFLAHASGSDVSPGATVAGSAMRYAGGMSRLQYGSTNNLDSRSGSAPAGTWRCMGNSVAINVCSVTSLFGSVFLRIS